MPWCVWASVLINSIAAKTIKKRGSEKKEWDKEKEEIKGKKIAIASVSSRATETEADKKEWEKIKSGA